MNHFKLFIYSLYGSIYFRIFVGYLRWFFFFKIRKNFQFINIKNSVEGTILHNKSAFVKFPMSDFTMKRMDRLIAIVKATEFIGENFSFLIIGPRTESDVMKLKFNFPEATIEAIDIISYSPWIDLQDAHGTNFKSNSFECVISGWVLKYSNDKEKMMSEMIRILKNEGIICIGIEYLDDQLKKFSNSDKEVKYLNSDDFYFEEVNSTNDIEGILKNIGVNYRIIYKYDALLKHMSTEDIYRITKLHSTQVMIGIQIFK